MMSKSPNQPLSDEEIHAILDGHISSDELAALEVRLSRDPSAQATLLKWQHQRLALKQLYQTVKDETVSSGLTNTVDTVLKKQLNMSWANWGFFAVSVFLAFVTGWLSHSAWLNENLVNAEFQASTWMPTSQHFAQQAIVAHALYSSDRQHSVEVTASDPDHLVKWLSSHVNKSLQLPRLTELGFELMGGRVLPSDSGARFQLMFKNINRPTITLYGGSIHGMTVSSGTLEAPFNFLDDDVTSCVYWNDQGFFYAIAGPLPRAELLQVAEAIYQQR